MICKELEGGIGAGAANPRKRKRRMLHRRDVDLWAFRLRSLAAVRSPLLLLLCAVSRLLLCISLAFSFGTDNCDISRGRGIPPRPTAPLFSLTTSATEDATSASSIPSTLPDLYPKYADILRSNGYTTPTPIQQSSATLAKNGDDLLLIAATGSGKTLAYLLPALSRACDGSRERRKTALIVAPTRELAAQLARDASLLLPDDEVGLPNVLLAVRGIPPPTPTQISHATVLVGTPNELYAVLTRISGAQNFLAGDTLSGLILDEVDVLLPPAPKTMRTTFDGNGAKQDRRKMEQRRKLRAAQRRGVEFHGGANIRGKSIDAMDLSNSMNSQVLAPTERVLRLIASVRFVGGDEDGLPLQVMAGSATASRATLDRLNKALRRAAMEGGVIGGDGLEGVWRGRMKVCRPQGGSIDAENEAANAPGQSSSAGNDSTHTIRAVTVPSAVSHKYVSLPKDAITNSHEILANVAKVAKKLKPQTSLVFICGEFSRSLQKEKKRDAPKVSGKTSQARRNAKRRQVFIARERSSGGKASLGGAEPLSVRKACSVLQSMGVDAQPMHVVLGLESNAEDGESMPEVDTSPDEVELPPVLVTFEGTARGLHFDGVDIVFVVGRPTSAASYLHLAGRVGRAVSTEDANKEAGEVEVRPGTVVSFCSKGRVAELDKWTGQVGATVLEEIVL